MKNFTIEQIRSLIRTEIGWPTNLDDDNDIYINFAADEDCPYRIRAYVMLKDDGERIKVMVQPIGYTVPSNQRAKILVALNDLNSQYSYITGVISEEGNIIFSRSTSLEQDVSDEYVVVNAIYLPIKSAFQYIAEVIKL